MLIDKKITAIIATIILFNPLATPVSYGATEAAKKEETPGEAKYKEAVIYYKKRQFKKAADLFWEAIVAGKGEGKVWIYCAHSHAGYGNYSKAREMYSQVMSNHKGMPEGKAAQKYLESIKDKKDNISEDAATAAVATKKLPPIAPASDLGKAVKLFNKKDYAGASALIEQHLKSNPKDAQAYYYRGLVAHYQSNTNKALVNYKKVYELAPDTELGVRAKKILAKFDPAYRDKKARATGTKTNVVESGLASRITILKPHLNWSHPKVRKATINTVKNVLRRLPPRINKVLFEAGVEIFIGPNYADQWPDDWLMLHPTIPDHYLFEEPSRNYTQGKHIYIFESNLYRSSFNSMAPYTQAQIRHHLYHEIGRSLDILNADFSNSEDLKKLYKAEIKRVSGNDKKTLGKLLVEKYDGYKESVAEIVAGLIGCHDEQTKAVLRNFPRTTQWIRNRLNL